MVHGSGHRCGTRDTKDHHLHRIAQHSPREVALLNECALRDVVVITCVGTARVLKAKRAGLEAVATRDRAAHVDVEEAAEREGRYERTNGLGHHVAWVTHHLRGAGLVACARKRTGKRGSVRPSSCCWGFGSSKGKSGTHSKNRNNRKSDERGKKTRSSGNPVPIEHPLINWWCIRVRLKVFLGDLARDTFRLGNKM